MVKLAVRYKASDEVDRIVLPHVMWTTDEGAACLFCIQIQDENGRVESTPKNLDPYRMNAVRIVDEGWELDPTFRRSAYSDREIICMARRK